jgi:hypothetical protein
MDIRWLRKEVEAIQKENKMFASNPNPHHPALKRSILMVSHHAPCMQDTSEPHFETSPWNSAFSTDLLERVDDWVDVKAWVYGHTHYSTELAMAGVRVESNQRGYVLPGPERKPPEGYGKGKWRRFDPEFVLRL